MPDSLTTLAVIGGAAALGGLVRGAAGFGGALMMVPLTATVMPPANAVPLVLLLEVAGYTDLLRHAGRRIDWRAILPLGLAALAAMPLGVLLLTQLPPEQTRTGIGLLILLFAAALFTGWRYAGKPPLAATMGLGGVSGLLNGLAGVPGPPVALFLYGGPQEARTVRDNLVGYFLLLDAATLVAFAVSGTVTGWLALYALGSVPIAAVFNGLGRRIAGRMPEAVARRVALGVVAAAGLTLLLR